MWCFRVGDRRQTVFPCGAKACRIDCALAGHPSFRVEEQRVPPFPREPHEHRYLRLSRTEPPTTVRGRAARPSGTGGGVAQRQIPGRLASALLGLRHALASKPDPVRRHLRRLRLGAHGFVEFRAATPPTLSARGRCLSEKSDSALRAAPHVRFCNDFSSLGTSAANGRHLCQPTGVVPCVTCSVLSMPSCLARP